MKTTPDELGSFVAPIDPPATYEEMQSRKNFRAPVVPKEHKLAEVLTHYNFEREAPCGLSTCKQGHLHGFLVRTEAGLETNLGHVCGKKNFPELQSLESRHRRLLKRKDVLSRITSLITQRPQIEHAIRELIDRPFGIKWSWAVRDAIKEQAGYDVFNDLCKRAKRDDYKVVRVKELDGAELEKAVRNSGRKREELRYVTEQVGTLPLLSWLTYDFRDELVESVRVPLAALTELDLGTTDTRLLDKAVRPLSGWEVRIETATNIVKQAPLFLTPSNVALMRELVVEFYRGKTRPGDEVAGKGKKRKGPEYFENWERTAEFNALAKGKIS